MRWPLLQNKNVSGIKQEDAGGDVKFKKKTAHINDVRVPFYVCTYLSSPLATY